MRKGSSHIYSIADEAALEAAAAALAQCVRVGDTVVLSGDLGAGKTRFVQAVARALGVVGDVVSPTFNILIAHESGRVPLYHLDLYRLQNVEQLEDIDFYALVGSDSPGVAFVEWGERFPGALPEDALFMTLTALPDGMREMTVDARGPRSEELLEQWEEACTTLNPGELDLRGDPAGTELSGLSRGFTTDDRAFSAEKPDSPVSAGFVDDPAGAVVGGEEYVLAFDTANETIAIGLGALDATTRTIELRASCEVAAHRASNTQLLPRIDALAVESGISREAIRCVAVGRGPGSFTGVRIAMATAKGIASALGVALCGVSSSDAVAWNAWLKGIRGRALVVADAMRKEVYPAWYVLADDGIERSGADRVVKAEAFAEEAIGARAAADALTVMGDALAKYADLFGGLGTVAPRESWTPSGEGLLLALQAAWRAGEVDPFDASRHRPGALLPVYTRLSDAEENERARMAAPAPKDLRTGVGSCEGAPAAPRATMHEKALAHDLHILSADKETVAAVAFRPLSAERLAEAAVLDREAMPQNAWSEALFADELPRRDRSWWMALASGGEGRDPVLAGFAGGMVVDGELQILKVAVTPAHRRRGIAAELLARVAEDARNLGAVRCTLEVRASNAGAQQLYGALGLKPLGMRPRYYQDREDALIMEGPLPRSVRDVAGMAVQHHDETVRSVDPDAPMEEPLILAIESSCDETAAALIDGTGALRADVLASQVDFHARFGGVVPEIASRKHIEAIAGVCEECLESAGGSMGAPVRWSDLTAIAATCTPGLVGALVVGVAFAKGAAWALDVPFIGVNHLEGHLYANKLGDASFAPPAVVSLVSGGNTMLVHMRDFGDYEVLGSTIDDAVGEAFDKVAKALGLGYPGGPVISRLAEQGDASAIPFPRAMLRSGDLRFSLSGLKTAVVTYIEKEERAGREPNAADIAASFQQAVVDVQVAKAEKALEQTGARTFCLGGGVAANPQLREAYAAMAARRDIRLVMPPLSSCGDNAGMIALVALDRFRQHRFFPLSADAFAHSDLEEPY